MFDNKVILRANKKTFIHYVMIYLLFAFNDSYLYKNYLSNYGFLLFLIPALYFLVKKKKANIYISAFLEFSLLCVVFTRFVVGGAGINAWFRFSVPISWAYMSYEYNKEEFLTRWVKLVVVMSTMSLIFWALCQINADFVRSIFFTKYYSGRSIVGWITENRALYQTEYGNGVFLYSVRHTELNRNNGIFSEPGLYQMVICVTIFILLFMSDKIVIYGRKRSCDLIVLIITLVTCQSTSGFLSAIVLIVTYMFTKNNRESGVKRRHQIVIIFLIALGLVLVEYSINGTSSILYSQVLKKISFNGTLSLSADSGVWRVYTIQSCWNSMLTHPLGIGYDAAGQLDVGAGAQIFVMGAALGIVPFIVSQIWTWLPVVKEKGIDVLPKIAFIFMYYNSMLAQSKEFYTAFVMFTVYYSVSQIATQKSQNTQEVKELNKG